MHKERTDPFVLQGTGWDQAGHMHMLNFEAKESEGFLAWQETVITKTRSDLEGLYFEYLVKYPVLPFDLKEEDGRIICPKYAGAPLPQIVSSAEREGTIKKTIEALEQKLIQGAPGDTMVLISPPGWSGYQGIHYPDTQIYYYQKLGTDIRSFTIVCPEADLDTCDRLRERLKQEKVDSKLTNKTRILNHTSSLIEASYLEPHDVVYAIEDILGTPLPHIYEALEKTPEIHSGVKSSIDDLENFIKNEIKDSSEQSQEKIMYKIGQTVLDMKWILETGRKPSTESEYIESYERFSEDTGCNGGGTIYGKGENQEIDEENEFPNWGICRLKTHCLSSSKDKPQALGLCMICKTCDRAFKSGKTLNEIMSLSKENSTKANTNNVEKAAGNYALALAAAFFMSFLVQKSN